MLLIGIKATAQQSQVTITYSMKVDSAMMATVGLNGFANDTDRLVVYYKQGKSLSDMGPAIPSQMLINDTGTIWLFTSPTELVGFIRYPLGFGDANNNNGQIIYIDSARQIAGYICKKAVIKENVKNRQDSIIVWYTQQLPVIRLGLLFFTNPKLKGTPLELEMILVVQWSK